MFLETGRLILWSHGCNIYVMSRIFSLKMFLALTVIITYSFLSLFGVLQTYHTSNMGHMTHSCPYVAGEQGMCPMNIFDHIAAWQQFSEAVFPVMEVLLLSLVVIAFFWLYFSSSPPLSYSRLRRRKFNEPLYQSLFSDGILNSKAF